MCRVQCVRRWRVVFGMWRERKREREDVGCLAVLHFHHTYELCRSNVVGGVSAAAARSQLRRRRESQSSLIFGREEEKNCLRGFWDRQSHFLPGGSTYIGTTVCITAENFFLKKCARRKIF